MNMEMEKFLELFKKINSFDIHNGLEFEVHSPGFITYRMKVTEKHLSTPQIAHGASIAGFMDCVLGLSALTEAVTRGNLTSTVEFKINFLRPVKEGDTLVGQGKVVHKGKSLVISSGEVRVDSTGDLVALGQGTFNLYPMSKREFFNDVSTNKT